MPPRISATTLPQPQICQCFRTRPRVVAPDAQSSRQFHAAVRKESRLRRDMYAWIKGPGKVFRDPLPASTNYLSAYDKQGNLLRARQNQERGKKDQDQDLEEHEEVLQQRDIDAGLTADQLEERATEREVRRAEKLERDARGGVPQERPSDLRPYPLNQSFRSQPVLSEDLREELYHQVVERRMDVATIAASFGVDIRRVVAVVRLKTIEKQWMEEGKALATPYAEAVLDMLPKTQFRPESNKPVTVHENINDLPVHPHTRQQIFYPASESRQFTREDAAKVFDDKLLPADKRIPLPMLVQLEKWNLEGVSREDRFKRQREADEKYRAAQTEKARKQALWEERTQRVVPGRRWDFKFQDISAEKVDKHGRGRDAVGYRYGFPHEDRKRGMVKIPTSVQ